ncbi:PREDICTED: killer cell immunoglobulin-like receptor 3DL3-like [Elephantulus edwardii]|uniref:killer cell immunoglobulin-like receptor 3DL3-like n=1 Tax=Elephantulus edwardii TaxID=28737 RepID=UPI0003F09CEC|nr:PREDICTED: killer cell immunoglobulin-like receptor 3DL3-like [Elephantulus edwardii]
MTLTLIGLLCLGDHRKPILIVRPTHVVPRGNRVTLECHCHRGFAEHKLYKGPVTPADAGSYKCHVRYHHLILPVASNPVEILVTGVYRKPSLLAWPGPLVTLGENVTLRCRSETVFDTYMLYKDEGIGDPLRVRGKLHDWTSQADFSMGPVTSDHAGTYRCYGWLTHAPYELSDPSDPLTLVITGNTRLWSILIGLSVVAIILVLLICFLIRRCCRAKKDATMLSREPDVDTTVSGKVPEEDPQEVTYTELRHWTPKKEKNHSHPTEVRGLLN